MKIAPKIYYNNIFKRIYIFIKVQYEIFEKQIWYYNNPNFSLNIQYEKYSNFGNFF